MMRIAHCIALLRQGDCNLKIPTLTQLRQHIRKHGWNGRDFTSRDSNHDVFDGQCEYASTSLSEMLTGKPMNWSLRVRGWYSGDLSRCANKPGCDKHVFTEAKHCHSWVEFEGKIIDPTYWQFAGDTPKIYVFNLDDPRYARDEEA
jgi:hypothetical protein